MEPHAVELLLLLALVPGAAQAAYTLSPVVVEGRPALLVSAISASGTIGGTFVGKTGEVAGFTRDGTGALTVLPSAPGTMPHRQVPVPTRINDRGIAAGFVARLGKLAGSFGPPGLNALPGLKLLTAIDHQGTVAYNTYGGSGAYSGFTGQRQPYGPAVFTQIQAANRLIFGPGRTESAGGVANDQGAVAGTYRDKDGSLHGFVDTNGATTSFDAPFGITAMAVAGFSNTGIVAGTYTDRAGAFHGFAWHDGRFSELLPAPSTARTITVAGVSDAGDVPLNLLDTKTGISIPYVAHCKDKGC